VGRLGGPSGPPWRGPCPVCLSEACLTLVFFAGFKWGFPNCLRGPRAVPDRIYVGKAGSTCGKAAILHGAPPTGDLQDGARTRFVCVSYLPLLMLISFSRIVVLDCSRLDRRCRRCCKLVEIVAGLVD
jgi:hypothetical protein